MFEENMMLLRVRKPSRKAIETQEREIEKLCLRKLAKSEHMNRKRQLQSPVETEQERLQKEDRVQADRRQLQSPKRKKERLEKDA